MYSFAADSVIVWFIVFFHCSFGCLSCISIIYWIRYAFIASHNKVTSFQKSFLWTNHVAIFVFGIVCIGFGVHSIAGLIASNGGTNYNKFLSYYIYPYPHIEIPIIGVFYTFDKVLLYCNLYLRLKYLLKDSLFEYDNNVYLKIKILIIINFFVISGMMLTIFIFHNIAVILSFFYLIIDIILPIHINILFIKKLRQIHRYMTQTLRIGTSQLQLNYNHNMKHNKQGKAKDKDKTTIDHNVGTRSPSDTQQDLNLDTDLDTSNHRKNPMEQSQSKIIINNDHDNVSSTTLAKLEQTKQIYEIIIRCTIITTIIAISTLMVLLFILIRSLTIFLFNDGKEIYITVALNTVFGSLDSLLNLVCMMAYFEFCSNFRHILNKYFCYGCKKCGCNNVFVKALLGS